MRRWISRIGWSLAVLVAVMLVAGAGYEWRARRAAWRDHPVRGTLVKIGGRRIQLDCRGAGSPTVVLESGLDIQGSLSWAGVHDSLATIARTCAYSRAGILWSDARRDAFSAQGAAEDLHATLEAAGVPAPIVLVGHSMGGPLSLVYTGRFPEQVAGLVLVDASHPDQVKRMEAFLPQPPRVLLAAFNLLAALPWTGIPRLAAPALWGAPELPDADRAAVNAYAGTSFIGTHRESVAIDDVFREAARHQQLGDRPLVVLTGARPLDAADRAAMGLSDAQADSERRVWRELQAEESAWSTRGRHEVLEDAGHYVHKHRPDAVIRAVRDVIGQVRRGALAP
jgi:pimeloyl-ACP methyl ester carboxylesterase